MKWPKRVCDERHRLQVRTQNDILCNRSQEFGLIHLCQILAETMNDLSKEQEQAIARSTMYLFAAILTILMVSLAGLFLSAELEQQAQNKEATSVQISRQPEVAPQSQRPWTRWKQQRPAMLPVKLHALHEPSKVFELRFSSLN